MARWRVWFEGLSPLQRRGVTAKLYNNFDPAMIDTLRVWALLVEQRALEIYLVDAQVDAVGKVDLIVRWNGQITRVALLGPTPLASNNRSFELEHRPGPQDERGSLIEMPADRPKGLGNKRWFRPEDLEPLWADERYAENRRR